MRRNNIIKKFNWKISLKKKFNISAQELWKLISQPSNLELFQPFCKKNKVIIWNDKESIDEVQYYNNQIFRRNFIYWKNNIGYDLIISKITLYESFVSWRIKKLNNKYSSLEISIYPYIFNCHKKILNFLPFYIFVFPKIKSYLNHIFKGINWYLNTGKKVSKNQFGEHPWFSTNS